jgi:large subunit ribosomal protein L33
MAKKSGGREYVALECPECKSRYYHTPKRTKGTVPKLELMKFCRKCRHHTKHLERRR